MGPEVDAISHSIVGVNPSFGIATINILRYVFLWYDSIGKLVPIRIVDLHQSLPSKIDFFRIHVHSILPSLIWVFKVNKIFSFFRVGLGNHYGTFAGPIGAFSPNERPKKPYKVPGKNVLTNPGKRGTGFGWVYLYFLSLHIPKMRETKKNERKKFVAVMPKWVIFDPPSPM